MLRAVHERFPSTRLSLKTERMIEKRGFVRCCQFQLKLKKKFASGYRRGATPLTRKKIGGGGGALVRGGGGVCEQNRVYLEAACYVFNRGNTYLNLITIRTRHLPNRPGQSGIGKLWNQSKKIKKIQGAPAGRVKGSSQGSSLEPLRIRERRDSHGQKPPTRGDPGSRIFFMFFIFSIFLIFFRFLAFSKKIKKIIFVDFFGFFLVHFRKKSKKSNILF